MGDKIRLLVPMVRGLIFALLLASCSVQAQTHNKCGDRELTIKELKKAGEVEVFRGYSDQSKLMIELYASPGGSWTVLVTSPRDTSIVCVGDYGQGGHEPPVKKIGIDI